MNVIIPMAGRGSRFTKAGYSLPKPLIDVNGKPMIRRVLENVGLDGRYVFIVLREHAEALYPVLREWRSDSIVIPIEEVTEGAACTCLLARDYVASRKPLLIANCDQIMDWDRSAFLTYLETIDLDGSILTFSSDSPNNSYVKLNRHGYVTQVAEKQVISRIASTGVYYFREGRFMVDACDKMIGRNVRTNNEFYLAPCYNQMIEDGLIVKTFPVRSHHPIGTPEELRAYLARSQTD